LLALICLCSCLPEGLSHHGIKPTAPSQPRPHGDSGSRSAFAPSLWAETEPGVIWVCLMLCWRRPDWLWHLTALSFPTCQIPLLPKAVTQEWRFCVADSVPVPLSGSDLEAYLIINPSAMHPASRLCLPLPYQTPFCSLPGPAALSFISVYFPLPGLTGTLVSHEKLVPWYLLTFLSYSHT
jgi:hypothetical protein